MPADTGGGEKTELPTPKKRQDAREEGQVAFSAEVNTTGMLLIGCGALAATGSWLWKASAQALRQACSDDLRLELADPRVLVQLAGRYTGLTQWLLVFVGVIAVAAITLSVAQVGFHPTLKPLQPKFDKLSPLAGLTRLFGLRGLVRLLVNVLKLALVVGVAWWMIAGDLRRELPIPGDLAERFARDCSLLLRLAVTLAGLLAAIAAADYAYQRFQHTRDLMMTKQEIKEEMKQSEGDPHVKGRIRQLQREMARKRMMQEVPKADVVITNPTHVAVALKYDREKMAAPVVVAKGYDAIAQRIKAIAAEHNVTMVENIQLARALAKELDIGDPVPVKWYQAVAEVLALVYRLRKAG